MIATTALLFLLATAPGPASDAASDLRHSVARAPDADTPGAPAAPTDSTADSARSEPDTTTAEVRRAIARIDTSRLLRVDGAFGRFHGHVSRADAGGLHGLRPDPSSESVPGVRLLRWEEIERVDMRGGNARRGAVRGALLMGAVGVGLGALIGVAMTGLEDGRANEALWALAGAGAGAVVGSAIGALAGAGAGAALPTWHNVYVRP